MFTMTPAPCAIICLPAHLQPRKTPLRLMPTTVFQPLIEMSSGLARNDAPALFTMTSSRDRKSTRLNSSHGYISYAVFCLKKKKQIYGPAIHTVLERPDRTV